MKLNKRTNSFGFELRKIQFFELRKNKLILSAYFQGSPLLDY